MDRRDRGKPIGARELKRQLSSGDLPKLDVVFPCVKMPSQVTLPHDVAVLLVHVKGFHGFAIEQQRDGGIEFLAQ